MALVAYPLGDCPDCGAEGSFGNIDVRSSWISRGCGRCQYKARVPLPPVRKAILYLDQFFLSHAFRNKDVRFTSAFIKIRRLAEQQLLVIPWSNLHEDEAHQWDRHDALMDFIKATSRGHQFNWTYGVIENQLARSFQSRLSGGEPHHTVWAEDAFDDDIHSWDSYYRIEIPGYLGDAGKIRAGKEQSVSGLVALFDQWQTSKTSFNEHVQLERQIAAKHYIYTYIFDFVVPLSSGNYEVLTTAPIETNVVQTLLDLVPDSISPESRLKEVAEFLFSPHFSSTPYQDISARMFAALRDFVKRGAYANRAKAMERLKGIFFDVNHIATYAPYCDAFIVDKPMANILKVSGVDVADRYGVRFFSLDNWGHFIAWLEGLERGMSDRHRLALTEAYPGMRV